MVIVSSISGQGLVQATHSVDSSRILRWQNYNAWGSGKGRRGSGGLNALVLDRDSVGHLFSGNIRDSSVLAVSQMGKTDG